ncbi:MAG: M16 family metallopeptidase [Candidatus Nanopelagicales bacterium]
MTNARSRAGYFPAREQRPGTTRTLLSETDGSLVKRTVLPGGLRVITEHVPGVRSASFGVWAGVGSRDETVAMAGSAHFLEHLLFKGTPTREALEISSAIEAVGGDLNAFTTKEYTCYYARVLDQDLPLAIDIICDIANNALIRKADVEQERHVILEEIAMRDDDQADSAHELFAEAMFGDHDLGRPILGTVDTIKAARAASIQRFYAKHYKPHKLVVAVAGNVDHATVVRQVKRAFAHVLDGESLPSERRAMRAANSIGHGTRVLTRKTEQAHLIWGVPGLARDDQRRYAVGVLNAVLGGGMSSRLFQEVREKRGMAYSVYSFLSGFADCGQVGVYVGTQPANIDEVLQVVKRTIADVIANGITADELDRGKGQIKGGMVLGLEDTGARMTRIAKAELVTGELPSIDEALRRIDAVTLADVAAVARDLFTQSPTLAIVGPFRSAARFEASLTSRTV